ncbi:c-type cytochrome [Duganella callida]|uniref:C-type cytochrome n=1 Tax=Duganella callida TaxID=2561932 RepID=A0A4Y9SQK2_9BURK|nr:c-type cytochrome [Duganella callida]TFW28818.1 c-type cytochrome [Duganella callida]
MNATPRKRGARWLWPLLLLFVLTVAALLLVWRPAITPLSEGPPQRFDPALVARGAGLAAIGNCAVCHTATPARPLAGGVGVRTPFGTVYSTNITPDRATGIGAWPQSAFTRALRDGVARDGHLLYPAFPYDHYTRLADGDIEALYAYIMTREPQRMETPANRLRFPFGFRPLLAGWNLLYLDHGGVPTDARRSAEWNRGAYLVEALGHCSACHTPRTALGGEDRRRYLGGGEAENWYVPALNRNAPSPTPWNVAQLTAYLRTGIAADHAIAAGPMQGVTASLARADEHEVRAIAVYIASQMTTSAAAVGGRTQTASARLASAGASVDGATPPPPAGTPLGKAKAGADTVTSRGASPPQPGDAQLQAGAQVYADACARCHDQGRQAGSGGALQLPLAVALYDPDPRSLLHLIRDGVRPADNQPGRWMPGFAAELSDEQVLALAAYLRQAAAHQPPWPDLPGALRTVKQP